MNNRVVTTLALTLIKGIGPSFIKKVDYTSVDRDVLVDVAEAGVVKHLTRSILEMYGKANLLDLVAEAVEQAISISLVCRDGGVEVVAIGNEDYPTSLVRLKAPPPIVYLRGNTELLAERILAVVGSRNATDEALAITRKVSERYRQHGFLICNGLAPGVDTASIRRADGIRAAIGVLGSGLLDQDLDQLPASYRKNAKELLAGQQVLLVSTCHPGTKSTSFTAIAACAYQAAMSDAVLLIESPETGGSRFTVEAAVETSRPVGVVWRSTWEGSDERRSLNAKLIGQAGASGILMGDKSASRSRLVILEGLESYAHFDSVIKPVPDQNPMGI